MVITEMYTTSNRYNKYDIGRPSNIILNFKWVKTKVLGRFISVRLSHKLLHRSNHVQTNFIVAHLTDEIVICIYRTQSTVIW